VSLRSYKDSYEFVLATLRGEASMDQMVTYEEFASKTLLIAAAGQHEKDIISILAEMPQRHKAPDFLSSFISKQALNRKYHTLFDWNKQKINSFAGLFGPGMRETIIEHCGGKQSTRDFFYIGSERNRIVHKGLATESIDKTFSEIWEFYESSQGFVNSLRSILH